MAEPPVYNRVSLPGLQLFAQQFLLQVREFPRAVAHSLDMWWQFFDGMREAIGSAG